MRKLTILESQFVKPRNEVYARHKLVTRNQSSAETVDEFLQVLKTLSADCNFREVTADEHRKQYIRDAFVRGLRSDWIRQRLLESRELHLDAAFDKARALEAAREQSKSCTTMGTDQILFNAAVPASTSLHKKTQIPSSSKNAPTTSSGLKCYFCGNDKHSRVMCPVQPVKRLAFIARK